MWKAFKYAVAAGAMFALSTQVHAATPADTLVIAKQIELPLRVLLLCLNYFYAGKLTGVNRTCVLLEDAAIVYETGEWGQPSWKDAQPTNRPVYVRLGCISAPCDPLAVESVDRFTGATSWPVQTPPAFSNRRVRDTGSASPWYSRIGSGSPTQPSSPS